MRLIILITSLLAMSSSIFAQQKSDIKVFDKKKLFVEPIGKSEDSFIFSSGYGAGEGKTWLDWEPWYGTNNISKGDFFILVGRNDIAKKYQNYSLQKNLVGWSSILLMGIGIGIAATTDVDNETHDVGTGLFLGGVGVGIIWFAISPPEFPYQLAEELADDYNANL